MMLKTIDENFCTKIKKYNDVVKKNMTIDRRCSATRWFSFGSKEPRKSLHVQGWKYRIYMSCCILPNCHWG